MHSRGTVIHFPRKAHSGGLLRRRRMAQGQWVLTRAQGPKSHHHCCVVPQHYQVWSWRTPPPKHCWALTVSLAVPLLTQTTRALLGRPFPKGSSLSCPLGTSTASRSQKLSVETHRVSLALLSCCLYPWFIANPSIPLSISTRPAQGTLWWGFVGGHCKRPAARRVMITQTSRGEAT